MAAKPADALLRRIPSVETILRSEATRALLVEFPRWAVTAAIRQVLEDLRAELRGHEGAQPDGGEGPPAIAPETLAPRIARLARPSLRRVINATGVVLHTNLGRAPLSARALAAVQGIAAGYCTLEYDPERRER